MITGNTVKRLNSGISPGQLEAERIQTLRPITNRDNQNSGKLLPVHQTMDQWRNDRHKGKQTIPICISSAGILLVEKGV